MRKAVILGMGILLAAYGLASGQEPRSPYEEVILEMLTTIGQMTKVLQPVMDEPSAAAARTAFKEAVGRFLKVRQKAEKLQQPDRAEKERITEAYQKKLADAMDGLRGQIRRVQALPSAREILKELQPLEPAKAKDKEKPRS